MDYRGRQGDQMHGFPFFLFFLNKFFTRIKKKKFRQVDTCLNLGARWYQEAWIFWKDQATESNTWLACKEKLDLGMPHLVPRDH